LREPREPEELRVIIIISSSSSSSSSMVFVISYESIWGGPFPLTSEFFGFPNKNHQKSMGLSYFSHHFGDPPLENPTVQDKRSRGDHRDRDRDRDRDRVTGMPRVMGSWEVGVMGCHGHLDSGKFWSFWLKSAIKMCV